LTANPLTIGLQLSQTLPQGVDSRTALCHPLLQHSSALSVAAVSSHTQSAAGTTASAAAMPAAPAACQRGRTIDRGRQKNR
jgi:hypothetical protein